MIKRLLCSTPVLTALLFSAILLTTVFSSCKDPVPTSKEGSNPNQCTHYACPQHPDHTSTVPAKCPECNREMLPVAGTGTTAKGDSAKPF